MKFLTGDPGKLKYLKMFLVVAAVAVLAVSCFAAWEVFFNQIYEIEHDWEPIILTDADRDLLQAVRDDNTEEVRRNLLAGGRADAINELGVTPLRAAIALNRPDAALELIRAGGGSTTGNSCLVYAIVHNRPQFVRELAKLSPNVNAIDRNGYTPLLYAISRNHVEVARELLNAGADVNAQGRNGVSPLIAAVRQGRADMVTELLKAGADFTVPSPSGETAMSIAQGNRRREAIAAILAEAETGAETMTHEDYLNIPPESIDDSERGLST